jgi:hypothetical protein
LEISGFTVCRRGAGKIFLNYELFPRGNVLYYI